MDIGALLRQARARGGMSQRDLARAAATSRSAITAYESGRKSPTTGTLDRLLAACGLQARVSLEPLLAQLDARVDALEGAVPGLDTDGWRRLADSLDDRAEGSGLTIGRPPPRRGPARWAVDGATALVLHGLAAELETYDLVVALDEGLRFWMKAVQLVGVDDREMSVRDWYDADLERMVGALGGKRFCLLGFVQIRVVEQLPSTLPLEVPWLDRPAPVVSVDEVERAHPVHAEVLARWRQRRAA